MVYPPGTILQGMYLKERLGRLVPGRFLEVGCGSGWVSGLLLGQGWTGTGLDLHAPSLARAEAGNRAFVERGRYETHQADFLAEVPWLEDTRFDLIISCMVVEHLDDAGESAYFRRCRELLAPNGLLITIVPGSEAHWGIEDEIAGHQRRYTQDSLAQHLARESWDVVHLSGLTFPLSNLLFGLSNALVWHAERSLRSRSMRERTLASGDRSVFLKTSIPAALGIVLNEWTLLPWHLAQKWWCRHPSCLVLYAESRPR
jgi:SAM-dependent methyltransferase